MLAVLARQSKPLSQAYSGERLVNYFVRPADGATQGVLIGRGAFVEHVNLGTGQPVRAAVAMGGAIYAVSGGRVWKVVGSVVTQVGTVTDGETYIAANRTQVAIVVGGKYYVCDGAATAEYTTGAVETPLGVIAADGYMIVIGQGAGLTDLAQVSGLDNATTFDGLDFAAAEYLPDAIVGAILDHGQVYLFGTETVEVFYNAGADNFPFLPNRAAQIEHGCLNGRTIAKADNAVYWVRPDGAVLRNFGGTPQVISTPEVKDALSRSTVTGALTFSHRGHEFYAVLRASGPAFVFDITTQMWSEWSTGVDHQPMPGRCRVTLGGVQYFGCANGVIATLSETVFTEFGGIICAEFETPLIVNRGELFTVSRLHIDVDAVGDIGRAPEAMLQTSRDGYTWGREKWRSLADAGIYGRRAVWNALGQFRRGKVRFRITDAVKRDVIGGVPTYG